ncbi:hypothetical protein [Pseudomonas sp. CGJS7]|uniref:hypothetical protein n=1 Tax=Pseudomonas sp. CGJS7 TaxID=3109348 RepID=UPI0030095A8F
MHVKSSAWSVLPALLFGACALLLPRPAQAQLCYLVYGYPVGLCASEPTQWANQGVLLKNVAQEFSKFTEMQAQLKAEKDKLAAMNLGSFGLDLSAGERIKISELETRQLSYGIEICQKGKTSVAEEQLKLCKKGVEITNRRFNAMVQMFKDIEARDKDIAKLQENRKSIPASDLGRLLKNDASVAALRAQMQLDMQNNVALLKAYKSMSESIDGQMTLLANVALTNKKTGKDAIGSAVQGIALSAGLKAAKARDL